MPESTKIPARLSEKIVSFINERIWDEYAAYYLYNAAANWCADKGFVKASKFFEGEASAELDHARGLQQYLVQWNVVPSVRQVETQHSFTSLPDIIQKAYRIEYDLYNKYNENSKKILVIDPSVFDFLQRYRKIQDESVAEFSDLLNALELIDSSNKFELLFFEQTYF